MNFLDPQLTNEGKPYGPERYKMLVRERYYISKNANISYSDTGNMTPLERNYFISFINDDAKRLKEQLDETKKESKNSRAGRKPVVKRN